MGETSLTSATPPATARRDDLERRPWLRWGRYAWATVGIVIVAALVAWALGRVSVVVIPLVLALFPAALLAPLARWLRAHRVPPALAALLSILALFLLVGAVIGGLVPLVASELPELIESFTVGVQDLERLLQRLPFAEQIGGLEGLLERAQEQLRSVSGEVASGAVRVASTAAEFVAGAVLMFFAVFFYLKDGERIVAAVGDLLPRHLRGDAEAMADRAWDTIGRYFRGQLLVALVDAVAIGVGLLILGVPLAVPLAVLVFFGGLFPVVGAVIAGAVAVLVALADSGLVTALIVLAVVVGVQQLEGDLLAPYILGNAISLHPLLVIVVLTAGGILFGVLGAFLAVPVAASVARAIDYVRERRAGAAPSEASAAPEPA
ncbi:MAG TPA: AI-2E family transporter [Egibacteraceae bacterium]